MRRGGTGRRSLSGASIQFLNPRSSPYTELPLSSSSQQPDAPSETLTARQWDSVPREWLDDLIQRALAEDLADGDRTSLAAIPEHARASAHLVAKAQGRLAGLGAFARTFELCDSEVEVELLSSDGSDCRPGEELARVRGGARALLGAERTALNLIQRASGIATRTARYVALCEGRARLLDTRKTTPTLRHLEKYSVVCGGGENHRFGLFDEVMLKENHIDLAGRPLEEVLASVRASVGEMRITCEARDGDEARIATRGGADVVLLDNMSCETMARLVPELRELARQAGRLVEFEASGGIDESTLGAVSRTGVDRISVGGLTHSAPALDLSLYLEPLS